jgi:DNA-binding CsgD family transcriptional regulator
MTTSPLTTREEQIRSLVVDGLSNEEIATRLQISSRTVEAHLRMLFRKLNVTRRDDLATPPPVDTAHYGVDAESGDRVIRHLEEELAALKRQVSSYDAAVRQMIERQFPLFEERVEITVTVGSSAGEDMVVERHWTRPKPYLVYRVARPLIRPRTAPPAFEDLGLTCEVIGQDMGIAVQPIYELDQRLLVLVFFQPGLRETTEWVVHYRTPGMWDPLRTTGNDTLIWSTSTLDNPSTPGIGDVTFYFDFPSGEPGLEVTQDRQTGDIKEDRLPGGETRFTWHNSVPGRHLWNLRMPI